MAKKNHKKGKSGNKNKNKSSAPKQVLNQSTDIVKDGEININQFHKGGSETLLSTAGNEILTECESITQTQVDANKTELLPVECNDPVDSGTTAKIYEITQLNERPTEIIANSIINQTNELDVSAKEPTEDVSKNSAKPNVDEQIPKQLDYVEEIIKTPNFTDTIAGQSTDIQSAQPVEISSKQSIDIPSEQPINVQLEKPIDISSEHAEILLEKSIDTLSKQQVEIVDEDLATCHSQNLTNPDVQEPSIEKNEIEFIENNEHEIMPWNNTAENDVMGQYNGFVEPTTAETINNESAFTEPTVTESPHKKSSLEALNTDRSSNIFGYSSNESDQNDDDFWNQNIESTVPDVNTEGSQTLPESNEAKIEMKQQSVDKANTFFDHKEDDEIDWPVNDEAESSFSFTNNGCNFEIPHGDNLSGVQNANEIKEKNETDLESMLDNVLLDDDLLCDESLNNVRVQNGEQTAVVENISTNEQNDISDSKLDSNIQKDSSLNQTKLEDLFADDDFLEDDNDFLPNDNELIEDSNISMDFPNDSNVTSSSVIITKQSKQSKYQPIQQQLFQHPVQESIQQHQNLSNGNINAYIPVVKQPTFQNSSTNPVASSQIPFAQQTYPNNNSFSPVISHQKLTTSLKQEKKKSDAYDFPQDLINKNKSKQPKEVKQNIYTQLENSSSLASNNLSQQNNLFTPPPHVSNMSKFSRTSSVSSPQSSFFAELPTPKLTEKKSTAYLKNPYETIENQSASKTSSTSFNNLTPTPPQKNNSYAPVILSPQQQEVTIASPVQNLPLNSLPPMKKPPNPYAPAAAGGHIRQISTTVSDQLDIKPNIIPVPMKSPLTMQQKASSNIGFNSSMKPNQLNSPVTGTNEQVQTDAQPRNFSNKYAPQQTQAQQSFQQHQSHQPYPQHQKQPSFQQLVPPQQHANGTGFTSDPHRMNSFTKAKTGGRNRLSISSINDVYGSNIVSSTASSYLTVSRKNMTLPPNPTKGKSLPSTHSSFTPAPVVINPENLVRRQWPLFSFSAEGKIASMVPSFDGYSHNICNIKVADISTALKQDSNITLFPGPLVKGKSKKKDIIKWLDDTIISFTTADSSPSFVEEFTFKCLKRMLEMIEKPGDFSNIEYIKNISKILNPSLTAAGNSNNAFDIIELTKITQSFIPAKPFNSYTLDANGLSVIHKMLEVGDKKSALEFAVSEGDWALALLISNLMGSIPFIQTIKLYTSNHFPTGTLGEDLSFFIQSNSKDALSAESLKGKAKWLVDNFKVVIPFIMSNNSNYGEILVQIGKVLTDSGYAAHGRLSYILSGLPIIPNGLNDLPTSIYGLIVEEVYEFILLSTGNIPTKFAIGLPHMIPIKIRHGGYLADIGSLIEAKKYYDSAQSAIVSNKFFCESTTITEQSMLGGRLSQVGSGWLSSKLSRPQIDRVLTSIDKSFNKFVSGGDVPEPDVKNEGIFSKFTSPASLSRTPSSLDLVDVKNAITKPMNTTTVSMINSTVTRVPPSVANGPYGIIGKSSSNIRHSYAPPATSFQNTSRPAELSIDSNVSNSYAPLQQGKYAPTNVDSLPIASANSSSTLQEFDGKLVNQQTPFQDDFINNCLNLQYTRTSSSTSIYEPPNFERSPPPTKKTGNPYQPFSNSLSRSSTQSNSGPLPKSSYSGLSLSVNPNSQVGSPESGRCNVASNFGTNIVNGSESSPAHGNFIPLASSPSLLSSSLPPPLPTANTLHNPARLSSSNNHFAHSKKPVKNPYAVYTPPSQTIDEVTDQPVQATFAGRIIQQPIEKSPVSDEPNNVYSPSTQPNVDDIRIDIVNNIDSVSAPVVENHSALHNSNNFEPSNSLGFTEEVNEESNEETNKEVHGKSISEPIQQTTQVSIQEPIQEPIQENVHAVIFEVETDPNTDLNVQKQGLESNNKLEIAKESLAAENKTSEKSNEVVSQVELSHCVKENNVIPASVSQLSPASISQPSPAAVASKIVPSVTPSNQINDISMKPLVSKTPKSAFIPNASRATSRTVNRYGPTCSSASTRKMPTNNYLNAYAPKNSSNAVYTPSRTQSTSNDTNATVNNISSADTQNIDMFSYGGYVPPQSTVPEEDEEVVAKSEVEIENLKSNATTTTEAFEDPKIETSTNSTTRSDIDDSIPTFIPPTQIGIRSKKKSIDAADSNLKNMFTPPSGFTNLSVQNPSSPIHCFTEEKRYHAHYTGEYYDDVIDDSDDDVDEKQKKEEARKKQEAEEKRKKEEEEKAQRAKKEEKENKKKEKQGRSNEQSNGWFGWLGKGKNDDKPKPIKAKLGEENSFYYDEKLKRWINKKAPIEEQLEASKPPPPPMMKKTVTSLTSNMNNTALPSPSQKSLSLPPSSGNLASLGSHSSIPAPIGAPKPVRKDSIDDLLNMKTSTPTGKRTTGRRGPRRGYVDVMGQQ